MKRIKPIAGVAIALAAIVLVSGLVAAGFGPGAAGDTANAPADDRWSDERIDEMLERLQERFDLTDEQVAELRATIEEKLEADAAPLEIRDAVIDKLESFGIEDPEIGPPADRGQNRWTDDADAAPGPAYDRLQERFDLTDDQIAEIRDTVETMVEDGADRGAIHDAIVAKLEDFGIEDPELGPPGDRGRNSWADGNGWADGTAPAPAFDRLQERFDLTDDQIAEIRETVESMLEDGADRAAIHDAIVEKLEEFGVDDPQLGPRAAWGGQTDGVPWGTWGNGNGNGPRNGHHGHGPGNGQHGHGHGSNGNGNGPWSNGNGGGQGSGQGNGPGNGHCGR